MRIVVIEDEEDLRNLVVFNLRAEGHEVVGAAGAGEGFALCARESPDVVVLDRMLPGAEGLDLCEQLRSDRELADVGVLVLSARGSVDDRLSGFDAGADDYVVKPFRVVELVARVAKVGEIAAKRRSRSEHPKRSA